MQAFQAKYSSSVEPIFVVFDFYCGSADMDLAVFKPDAIIAVEMKECSNPIEGGDNGKWTVADPRDHDANLGAGSFANPFQQIRQYRYELIRFLDEKKRGFLAAQKASQLRFGQVSGIVAISPSLNPASRIDLDFGRLKWFHIVGLDELAERIGAIHSPDWSFSAQELERLVRNVLHCAPATENVGLSTARSAVAADSQYDPKVRDQVEDFFDSHDRNYFDVSVDQGVLYYRKRRRPRPDPGAWLAVQNPDGVQLSAEDLARTFEMKTRTEFLAVYNEVFPEKKTPSSMMGRDEVEVVLAARRILYTADQPLQDRLDQLFGAVAPAARAKRFLKIHWGDQPTIPLPELADSVEISCDNPYRQAGFNQSMANWLVRSLWNFCFPLNRRVFLAMVKDLSSSIVPARVISVTFHDGVQDCHGWLSLDQFPAGHAVAPGDRVDVVVSGPQGEKLGYPLSRAKVRRPRNWSEVEKAYAEGSIVFVKAEELDGGDLRGKLAGGEASWIMPANQIHPTSEDWGWIWEYEVPAKILKLGQGNQLEVSRNAALEELGDTLLGEPDPWQVKRACEQAFGVSGDPGLLQYLISWSRGGWASLLKGVSQCAELSLPRDRAELALTRIFEEDPLREKASLVNKREDSWKRVL
jgi:hypothetical protein